MIVFLFWARFNAHSNIRTRKLFRAAIDMRPHRSGIAPLTSCSSITKRRRPCGRCPGNEMMLSDRLRGLGLFPQAPKAATPKADQVLFTNLEFGAHLCLSVHGHVGSPHLSAIGHYPWPARRARTMMPMASGRFPSVLASIARVQIKQTKSIATAASPIVSVISRQLEAAAEFLGASWRGVYGRESSCRHG